MQKRHIRFIAGSVLLLLYVVVYIGLSRYGYAESRKHNLEGFYYFTPKDLATWRLANYGCVCLFWPLNIIDQRLGTGMAPASEPLWRLTSSVTGRMNAPTILKLY